MEVALSATSLATFRACTRHALPAPPTSLDVSADGERAVIGCPADDSIHVYDCREGQ